ncbi:protein LNK3 isoform X2 [Pistacia vera]|uniref:protein LNK3 isoform X2 n=1 Tax=Pistacia vera TaxID=55513 RepID=UPI001263D047|nr:protein LNK3 isoform X2 [Pistacia vera]
MVSVTKLRWTFPSRIKIIIVVQVFVEDHWRSLYKGLHCHAVGQIMSSIHLRGLNNWMTYSCTASSLLDDQPRDEDIHKLFGVLPANNRLTDMTLDSKSGSSDKHSIGSSKYLQTHAFSPSVGWEEEVAASPFIPCNTKQRLKAPVVRRQVPSEENTANELVADETSLEESVLQELRVVMEQMTDNTRIFFRDALYRLAESSKQHVIILRQSGDSTAETPLGATHDTHMRSTEKQAMESETNVVDRTIANLMFSKMDVNVQGTSVAAEINLKQEVMSVAEVPILS